MMRFRGSCLVLLLGSAVRALGTDSLLDLKWVEFKHRFGREYKNVAEETERKVFFINNLARAAELNREDNNVVPYGHLSPLADWSRAEFDQRNRRVSPKLIQDLREKLPKATRSEVDPGPGSNANPLQSGSNAKTGVDPSATKTSLQLQSEDNFDWREKGAVNKVKNQGQCGSCWSFSTVANIEGVGMTELKHLYNLSEQQLVDCDKDDNGCNGGLPEQADKWLIAHDAGLELESVYPYEGKAGKCRQKAKRERVFVGKFVHVSSDEAQMARALVQYGPLSIGINANTMQLYTGGIAQPSDTVCNPDQLNHGVALVGYGVGEDVRNAQKLKQWIEQSEDLRVLGLTKSNALGLLNTGKKVGEPLPFWIVRNSWGEEWGEAGYYRIVRGKGACGLNQLVTSATDLQKHAPTKPAQQPEKQTAQIEEVASRATPATELYV